MKKIYFLKIMCEFNDEAHYENVYSTKEIAIQQGIVKLENIFKKEYEKMFEQCNKDDIPKLSREQLFKLQALYDFSITEYDPEYVDSLYDFKNLPIIVNFDTDYLFCADLDPAKIVYSYDYNGNANYISGIYIFNYNGERKEHEIMMRYEDYIDSKSGTKFKIGDIVRIRDYNQSHYNYEFYDKLHVITDIPHKKDNQNFFKNTYTVIVNHNSYDEGCHIDVFDENELELYTGTLPKDSPILFLSKYFAGKIKLNNIKFTDIESGKITLNENKSFRDIPEIMEQLIERNKG